MEIGEHGWTLASLGLLVVAVIHAQLALAEPLARPTLHWARGPGAERCVDPRALSQRVEVLLGSRLVRASEAEHSVEGTLELQHDRIWVRLRVSDARGTVLGERTLEQPESNCARLTPAIAFVIAVLLDPEVAAHGLPAEVVGLLGTEPVEDLLLQELERDPPSPISPPVVPAPDAPAQLRASGPVQAEPRALPAATRQAWLLGELWLFEAPRLQAGVEADLLGQVASWLSFGGYARVAQQLGDHEYKPGASVQLLSMEVGAPACAGQDATKRLRVQACLGPLFSLIRGKGDGLSQKNDTAWLGQAGASGLLSLRLRVLGAWGIVLAVRGRIAAQERTFTYTEGNGEKHRAARVPPASLGVALGPSFEY